MDAERSPVCCRKCVKAIRGQRRNYWPECYCELRPIAGRLMAHEAPGHVLQPTALVHEAWLRLGGGTGRGFPTQPISSEIPFSPLVL